MTIIKLKNLSKTYEYYEKEPGMKGSLKALFVRKKQYAQAVREISFSINEGELVGFIGPNGAGKTTTLKMLSGLIHPSSGELEVLGYTPWQRQKQFQKQFALVMGQKNQLWWDLPPQDSFLLNKEIYGVSDKKYKKNLAELVSLLGVEDILKISVRKLSLGQRMKCELIAALLHQPKVLFLDEPTIGLDVVAQKNIRDFIKKYNEKNRTSIILTSHYMEDIKELCQRIIIIDRGRIIYDGKLEKAIKKYATHKELKISFSKEGVKKEQVEKFAQVIDYSPYLLKLRVNREKTKEVAAQILASDLPVDDIIIDEMDLQEVIRKIFNSNSKKILNKV